MTKIEFDSEFYENVDEFIRFANELAQKCGDEKLAAVFNFAASRYSAYLAAANSNDVNEFNSMRAEVVDYFCPIYKSNLERNLDHFDVNYKEFIDKER